MLSHPLRKNAFVTVFNVKKQRPVELKVKWVRYRLEGSKIMSKVRAGPVRTIQVSVVLHPVPDWFASMSDFQKAFEQRPESPATEDACNGACTPEFLQRLRPILIEIARDLVDRDLQAKIGTSDLVQETMLEAMRAYASLRAQDTKQLRRWSRKAMVNSALDVRRLFQRATDSRVKKEKPLSDDIADPRSLDSADQHILREEELLQMQEAIGRLPTPHQQMLQWRYLDRYSYAKIAMLVSRREDAVRMMVNRSLDRLKIEMKRLNDYSSIQ